MKRTKNDDFFVTVKDEKGAERIILLWDPLAILAHSIVIDYGGSEEVARKASIAVRQHGKEINHQHRLTVKRQVIMAARKAADAVIEDLGNGDVAAAVLEAIRVGGEKLVSAQASGNAIDVSVNEESEASVDNTIHVTLSKPLGIVFSPITVPEECGVRISKLRRNGAAFLCDKLKVYDELLSINGKSVIHLTLEEVQSCLDMGESEKQFDLVFRRPDEKQRGIRHRVGNVFKRDVFSGKSKQTSLPTVKNLPSKKKHCLPRVAEAPEPAPTPAESREPAPEVQRPGAR